MAVLDTIFRDMALQTLMEDRARKKREQAAWRKRHEGKAKARGEMRATPRNAVVGLAAEGAMSLKDLANSMGRLPGEVPMLGGMGAGDILMGEGPEMLNDLSYGDSPVRGTGMTWSLDPRMVDLAGMGLDAFGAKTLAKRAGKSLLEAAVEPRTAAIMQRGSFGDSTAKKAPLDKLKRAEALKANGADQEQIWRETGWWVPVEGGHNPPGGTPLFEIQDPKGPGTVVKWTPYSIKKRDQFIRMADEAERSTTPYAAKEYRRMAKNAWRGPSRTGDRYIHPELYANYPSLAEGYMRLGDEMNIRGEYNRGTHNSMVSTRRPTTDDLGPMAPSREATLDELAQTAAHEVASHGAQSLSPKMSVGGSPSSAHGKLLESYRGGYVPKHIAERLGGMTDFEKYQRLGGEGLSRLAETRLMKGYDNAPWKDLDVPAEELIDTSMAANPRSRGGGVSYDMAASGVAKQDLEHGQAGYTKKLVSDEVKLARLPREIKTKWAALKKQYPNINRDRDYFTSDEIIKLVDAPQEAAVAERVLSELPKGEDMAELMRMGEAKRGWYEASSKAIRDVFGDEDARKFARLLAATSPQQPVQGNMQMALGIWEKWDKAGRPHDPKFINKLIRQEGGMSTYERNAHEALFEPPHMALSGPKVSTFARNLQDDILGVTEDAWQSNAMGIDQGYFAGKGGKTKGRPNDPGLSGGYMAANARMRRGANVLGWDPREAQEAYWSVSKFLKEAPGSAEQMIRDGKITHEQLRDIPDFSQLIKQPEYASKAPSLAAKIEAMPQYQWPPLSGSTTAGMTQAQIDAAVRGGGAQLDRLGRVRGAEDDATRFGQGNGLFGPGMGPR